MSVRKMLYKFAARAYEISPSGVLKYNLMDNIKYVNILLYILIFGLEIESSRLDFHVDATWTNCHIRQEQPMKIEPLKVDLGAQNRVSETRVAKNIYSL